MILGWRNLPDVAKYMYSDHEITSSEHDVWFQRALSDATRRYWIIVCDGQDVGLANTYDLDVHNKRCYWAFYLASSAVRGKGVGGFVEYSVLRHVFDELQLNKVCCEVLAFNEAVIKMHEAFGFRREGILRQHVLKAGLPHDVVYLGMLREEWRKLRPEVEHRLRQKGLL